MTDEYAIKNSFRAVKGDIIKIEGELMNLKLQQAKILEQLEKIDALMKKPSRKRPAKKRS